MSDYIDLDGIERRVNAATKGPWIEGRPDMATLVDGFDSKWIYAGDQYCALASSRIDGSWEDVMSNARFIAAARTDVPALVAEVRRLREENGTALRRCREATQTIIETIGSVGPESIEDAARRVAAKVAAGDRILHEIACATPKLDDPRLDYVEIQVDRATIAELAAYREEWKDGTK